MATFTLTQHEIEQLEQRVQEATQLPWRCVGAQCEAPNFTPIFSFQYEQNIGPQDELPLVAVIKAQSNGSTPPELYAIGFITPGAGMEALRLLQMVNEDR